MLFGRWRRKFCLFFSFPCILTYLFFLFSLLSSIAKAIKPETQQKKEKAQQKTAAERAALKKTRKLVCKYHIFICPMKSTSLSLPHMRIEAYPMSIYFFT